MARSMDIFVESAAPLKIFAKEIGTLLGVEFQAISDDTEVYYEFQNSHIIFTVGTHNFVNDRDMNFEDYHYHLSVWALNIGDGVDSNRWRDEFVRKVFEKLKATRRYPLMLVEDIQMKVEAFCPESDTVQGGFSAKKE